MKSTKQFHTAKSNKIGTGDYYGGGIRQPIGKLRDVYATDAPKKGSIKTPPKSLA